MNSLPPLLLELFDRLRRYGVPLGVGDYLLANQVLSSGVGLEDPDDLKTTLRLFWAKSLEDQALFDEAFELLVAPKLRARPTSAQPAPPAELPKPRPMPQDPPIKPPGPVEASSVPNEEPTQPQEIGQETFPLRLGSLALDADAPKAQGTYQFIPHLPIQRREMASIWRHLRQLKREGPAIDLDVEGTLDSISRNGYFLRPVLQARRRNQAKLVMLIDCYETMTPFSLVTQALVDSVRGGGLLGHMVILYFNYCPDKFLSHHSSLEDPRPATEMLKTHARNASVLIVSDVDAARGAYSQRRAERVREFLRVLHEITYLYAWLNPLPIERWKTMTAEDIAMMAPMYPLDRDGLIDAVNILRGRPPQPRITLTLES